jgi:hypothetical protein
MTHHGFPNLALTSFIFAFVKFFLGRELFIGNLMRMTRANSPATINRWLGRMFCIWVLALALYHMDGRRGACYPHELITEHWAFYNSQPINPRILDVNQANLALLPANLAGAAALAKLPGGDGRRVFRQPGGGARPQRATFPGPSARPSARGRRGKRDHWPRGFS